MSSFSLTEYLLRPVVMPEGAIVTRHAAGGSAPDAGPTFQSVMRSSRARAWIPPLLIESLREAATDSPK